MTIKTEHKYESETIDGKSELGYRGTQKTGGSPGKSNTTALQQIFSGAPTVGYAGPKDGDTKTVSAEAYKEWFFRHVVNGKVSGVGYGLGEFDLDFAGAPDLDNVDVKGKNLATPFVPNPTSPGEGNADNAASKPKAPASFVENLRPNTSLGGQGLTVGGKTNPERNPAKTAAKIKAAVPSKPKS